MRTKWTYVTQKDEAERERRYWERCSARDTRGYISAKESFRRGHVIRENPDFALLLVTAVMREVQSSDENL